MKTSQKVLVSALMSLGVLAAANTHAAVITTNTIEGFATAGTGADQDSDSFGPTSSNTGISDSASAYTADYSSYSDGSGWVSNSGPYRADAHGGGDTFEAQGSLVRSFEVANDLGFAADYSLEFFIYYGSMSAYGTGTGTASYDLKISDGGDVLFASGATIDNEGNLTQTGTVLDGASHSGNYYSWGGTYVTIGLGTLADGQSKTLNYDLVTSVFGDYDNCSGGGEYYGDVPLEFNGDLPVAALTADEPGVYCSNSVYLGDPFTLIAGAQPIVSATPVSSQQVPEPIGLGLVGLGLSALVWQRRKSRI